MIQIPKVKKNEKRMRKSIKLISLAFFMALSCFAFITIPTVVADPDDPIFEEYWVPVSGGVNLYTRVYRPDSGAHPVILTRTPYGIGELGVFTSWPDEIFNGYVYVAQDTRGRYYSQGVDRLFYDDGPDGYDTIEWIASQPWCNGKVGIYGGSASGITAYLAAGERPPHLVTALSYVASANLYNDLTFDGGAYRYDSTIWTYFQTLQGLSQSHLFTVVPPTEWSNIPTYMYNLYQNVMDITSHVLPYPPNRAIDSPSWMNLPLMGGNPSFSILQPFGDEILSHPSEDAFRDKLNVHDTIEIPILHVAGWYDFFSRCTIDTFVDLQYLGNQKLFILNGTHGNLGEMPYDPYYDWFDYWLKGEDTGIMDEPPVWYIGLGDNEWRYADQWPPTGIDDTRFYMHDDGALDTKRPNKFEDSISYTYDPMNPVLTWGGRNLGLPAGALDQTPVVMGRDDILSYTTQPLKESMEITGPIKVYLSASSDCLDTDFTAKLIDVHPDGKLINVADGIIRARYRNSMAYPELMSGNPDDIYEFTINMGDICKVFKEGHAIRIDISSSNFPKHDRNLNTGGELYTETEDAIQVAENTIHHARCTPSYIVLPIMSKEPKVFEGDAKIKLPDLKYQGAAELHIYGKAVYLHFNDQWIKWDINRHYNLYNVDLYKCGGELGKLNVVVVNSKWGYQAVASGHKISFISKCKIHKH